MIKVRIRDIQAQLSRDSEISSCFQNPLATTLFLNRLDDPYQTGILDGFLQKEDYKKLEDYLEKYTTSRSNSGINPLCTENVGALFRQKFFAQLFPTVKTAEDFLLRNDLYIQAKLTDEFYSLCQAEYDYLNEPFNRFLSKEPIKKDFSDLSDSEKLKTFAILRHYNLNFLLLIIPILFPDFTEAIPEIDLANIQKILKDILKLASDWKRKQDTSLEIVLKIQIRLLYLKALLHQDPNNSLTSQIKTEAISTLKDLHSDELFSEILDTDFDGIVDKNDHFPYHTDYQSDLDQDGIPDLLASENRGLKDHFGILESKFGKVHKSVDYFRLKDEIYLVANIAMKPDKAHPEIQRLFPFYRYLQKKQIEDFLAKSTPKIISSVHLRVNFYPEEQGEEVFIVPGNKLSTEIVANKSTDIVANKERWPMFAPINFSAHETGHHFKMTDSYDNQYNLYFNQCAPFSPRLFNSSRANHLMSDFSPHLDSIDFIPLLDHASKYPDVYPSSQLMEGEIRYQSGDFENAAEIYFKVYERLKTKLSTATPQETSDRATRTFIEAIRGLTLAQIRLYEKTKDPALAVVIENNISYLELLSHRQTPTPQNLDIQLSTEWIQSVEAEESWMDAKILKYLFALAQERSEQWIPLLEEVYQADSINQGSFAKEKMYDLGIRFLPPAYFKFKNPKKRSH